MEIFSVGISRWTIFLSKCITWRWRQPFKDLGNIKILQLEKLNPKLEKRFLVCVVCYCCMYFVALPSYGGGIIYFCSAGSKHLRRNRKSAMHLLWTLLKAENGECWCWKAGEGGPNISLLDICSGPRRSLAWSPRLPPGPGSVITWFRNQDSKLQKWGQHHFSKLSNERLSWF